MNTEKRAAFLRARLDEQRHLLRKSITEMIAGDLAEAIRIATTIRVLVHETASSKPLLKQLMPDYLQLDVLDRIVADRDEPLTPGQRTAVLAMIPVTMNISKRGVALSPEFIRQLYQPSTLRRWWERPALILLRLGGFSRRELILGLANKEGGAHVDVNVSQRYQALLDDRSFFIEVAGQSLDTIQVSRLMVGQAGIELLECLDRRFPPP